MTVKQESFEKDGLHHPTVFDSIIQLKGEDLEEFIKHSVLGQEEVYKLDTRTDIIQKLMQDG